MFGRDWEPAEATIVERRLLKQWQGAGGAGLAQMYEYLADIRPDDGSPPFRASLYDPTNAGNFRRPEVGEVARVKFRDSARQQQGSMKWRLSNVKFDQSDPNRREGQGYRDYDKRVVAEANSPEAQKHWDAVAAAKPGTAAQPDSLETSSAAGGPSAMQADMFKTTAEASATSSRLSAGTADLSETMTAIKRAAAAGDFAEVQRLKSEFQSRALENSAAAHQAAADLSAKAAASDPLERLQKLADLHDRGVLTEAEFAAEKAKILGS